MGTRLVSILTALALLLGAAPAPTHADEVPVELFPALDFSYRDRLDPADINRTNEKGETLPWGANNWNCTPSPAHPTPVVLVHAYSSSMRFSWALISPLLVAAGYCVYAFNWGEMPETGQTGVGPLRDAAAELRDFVDKVRARTGASEVDLVGHSAGGLMPHWYLKKLGGHKYVRQFVAIAPATHGTDVGGLATANPELIDSMIENSAQDKPAGRNLMPHSSFVQEVSNPTPALPDVTYTVVATRYDTTVTPVRSQFIPAAPNVTNILVQDVCPLTYVGHGTLVWHPVMFQLLQNILGGNDYPIRCA